MNYEDEAKLEAIGAKVNAMMSGLPLFT